MYILLSLDYREVRWQLEKPHNPWNIGITDLKVQIQDALVKHYVSSSMALRGFNKTYDCTIAVVRADRTISGWLAIPCDQNITASYICEPFSQAEITPNQSAVYGTESSVKTCPQHYMPIGDACFLFLSSEENGTLSDAQKHCGTHGGQVINVHPHYLKKRDDHLAHFMFTREFRDRVQRYRNTSLDKTLGGLLDFYSSNFIEMNGFSLDNVRDTTAAMVFEVMENIIRQHIEIPSDYIKILVEIVRKKYYRGTYFWVNVGDHPDECCQVGFNLYAFSEMRYLYGTDRLRFWGIRCNDCSFAETPTYHICQQKTDPKPSECGEQSFTCNAGNCILNARKCDSIDDCEDGEDESECSGSQVYVRGSSEWDVCSTGDPCDCGPYHTLAVDIICDGITSCHPALDETHCQNRDVFKITRQFTEKMAHIENQTVNHSLFRCRDMSLYSSADLCFYDLTGNKGCTDLSHLTHCRDFNCQEKFKCHESYCIDFSRVCDGEVNCALGEDENEYTCGHLVCAGRMRCRGETRCLDEHQLCDGQQDCLHTADDELICVKCPEHCHCQHDHVSCQSLQYIHNLHFRLYASMVLRNMSLKLLSMIDFAHMIRLISLDVSQCGFIDISYGISKVSSDNQLRYLNGSFNNLQIFRLGMLRNYLRLFLLDLSHNNIEILYANWQGQSSLKTFLLQSNTITFLTPKHTSILKHVSLLDIRYNPLMILENNPFLQMMHLRELISSSRVLCCFVSHTTKCSSRHTQTNNHNCSNFLLKSQIIFSAALGITFVVGNGMNLLLSMSHVIQKSKNRKYQMFKCFSLIGNILMSINLLVLLIAGFVMNTRYYALIYYWKSSSYCIILSYSYIFASQQGIMTFTLRAVLLLSMTFDPYRKNTFFANDTRIYTAAWIFNGVICATIIYYQSILRYTLHSENIRLQADLCDGMVDLMTDRIEIKLPLLLISIFGILCIMLQNVCLAVVYLIIRRAKRMSGQKIDIIVLYNIIVEASVLHLAYLPNILYKIYLLFHANGGQHKTWISLIMMSLASASSLYFIVSRHIVSFITYK